MTRIFSSTCTTSPRRRRARRRSAIARSTPDRRSDLRDPGPIHRPSHRASGGTRTRVARFAGVCLCRSGYRCMSQFRCKDSNLDVWCQRPASYHWTTPDRWGRHPGSNRAFSRTRRACRAAVTMTANIEGVRRESNPFPRESQTRMQPVQHAHHERHEPATRPTMSEPHLGNVKLP